MMYSAREQAADLRPRGPEECRQEETGRMVGDAKEAIREQVRRSIRALTVAERAAKSEAVCKALLGLPEVCAAKTVLLYAPLPDEVNVWAVFHALTAAKKRILLPKCLPRMRGLLCIRTRDPGRDLAPGTLGILEPRSNRGANPCGVDVVIVPGRAFDRFGNRVGRGAGHYDWFLARISQRAFKCGVGFDCQLFDKVPTGPCDVPVDAVVTESIVIRVAAASDKKRGDTRCCQNSNEDQRSPIRGARDNSARRPRWRN